MLMDNKSYNILNYLPKFFLDIMVFFKQILNTKRDKNSRIISVNNMSHNGCREFCATDVIATRRKCGSATRRKCGRC
jgi:hypothetical protein